MKFLIDLFTLGPARRFIRQRIRVYIQRRLKRVPGPVTIQRQRIYIVPTRMGYIFGVMVFVMLMGSMNYSNSLGFALTFLLTALGMVGMHHTHRNMFNVRVRAGRHAPVFAGQDVRFQLVLDNPSQMARYSLALGIDDDYAFAPGTDRKATEPPYV